jgi:hypothetical protein
MNFMNVYELHIPIPMKSKKYISTHISREVNPLSNQPNSDFIYNNINVNASFEVLLAPYLNTGVFTTCLIESFKLLSSRLSWW